MMQCASWGIDALNLMQKHSIAAHFTLRSLPYTILDVHFSPFYSRWLKHNWLHSFRSVDVWKIVVFVVIPIQPWDLHSLSLSRKMQQERQALHLKFACIHALKAFILPLILAIPFNTLMSLSLVWFHMFAGILPGFAWAWELLIKHNGRCSIIKFFHHDMELIPASVCIERTSEKDKLKLT